MLGGSAPAQTRTDTLMSAKGLTARRSLVRRGGHLSSAFGAGYLIGLCFRSKLLLHLIEFSSRLRRQLRCTDEEFDSIFTSMPLVPNQGLLADHMLIGNCTRYIYTVYTTLGQLARKSSNFSSDPAELYELGYFRTSVLAPDLWMLISPSGPSIWAGWRS